MRGRIRRAFAALAAAAEASALAVALVPAAQAVPIASGLSGVHVVTGSKVWVGLHSSAKGLAFCPSGEVAIGGGVDSGSFTGQSVVTSRPAGHNDQWLIRMYNNGNSLRFGNYFYPIAVCAPTGT
jgi:hypothetical protein